MIKIEGLSHKFKERVILDNLNLEVSRNTFHTIIGLNGVGKSLTLRLISELETRQSGNIEYQSKKITFVFQNAAFFPWLTISKNLEVCSDYGKEYIFKLLKDWKLEKYSEMFPNELSGGTLQKVNLIRAFMQNADLILMDEPFSHLDIIQKEEIYQFTSALFAEYKTTVVFVTHDIDEALFLSNQISYLSKKSKNITTTFPVMLQKERSLFQQKTIESHLKYFSEIYNLLKSDMEL
ncbi:MAG: ATP-binding cassette domain-containing protein [Bacteriovorax sp.]|jgi:ABC-type nitrate/sulfonate/bicarbonate transport system ATPase subunit